MNSNTSNINLSLSKMLIQYRSMQHASTSKTPAEMFIGRKLSTRLDLIIPVKEEKNVEQNNLCKYYLSGERVACRNYSTGGKWKFGRITEKLGKLHYKILLDDGRSWTRHINQIRSIGENTPALNASQYDNSYWNDEGQRPCPDVTSANTPASPQSDSDNTSDVVQPTQRRSTRIRKKPDWYEAK